MILHTGGTRPEFFNEFKGAETWDQVRYATNWGGTDQAWISYRARRDHDGNAFEAHWTDADGVYGAGRLPRKDLYIERLGGRPTASGDVYTTLPDNARIVFTPGARTPWTPGFAEQHPWAAAYELT